MKEHSDIQLWSPPDTVTIAKTASMAEIVEFSKPQLSQREMKSIVTAFENGSYEMVATFVWTKAAAVLKKQLASLGMDFVGEMLGRPDLTESSDPSTSISDSEALSLAEDLGLINATQGLRLSHALELVTHFIRLEDSGDDDQLEGPEVYLLVKTCISSILRHPKFDAALKFASLRSALGSRTLKAEDGEVMALAQSPYFFVRTTLSILLSLSKTSKGAIQEHVLGNLGLLLPLLWERLREPEKWQIGQAYAEVNAEGNRAASSGLKAALIKVHGFDFVPETLRSTTFAQAAASVMAAHFAMNNFYNEQEPMIVLANLGTAIPKPAFAKCMQATLAVWLGNSYGHAWNASEPAERILKSLRKEQWEYYFNECLERDRVVLEKLTSSKVCVGRWMELVTSYRVSELNILDKMIKRLVGSSVAGKTAEVQTNAANLRENVLA